MYYVIGYGDHKVISKHTSKVKALEAAVEAAKGRRPARTDVWEFRQNWAVGFDVSDIAGKYINSVLITWTDQTPEVRVF